jgi:hypothetical protein
LSLCTFCRMDVFSEWVGAGAIPCVKSKSASWVVHCLDHPQGLSPSIPSPPLPHLRAFTRGSSFGCHTRIWSPSTTPPHLGLLHSPSSLPGEANLPPPIAPPTHILSSLYCGFIPNSSLCGCLKVFLLVFPPSVLFHLVPTAPSVTLPFPFLLSTPHFQQLSIHILLSLACPVVGFQILVNLHQPFFLFLLPQVHCISCTVTNVFEIGEGPPLCVFSFMC